jgi:hypothetical protein
MKYGVDEDAVLISLEDEEVTLNQMEQHWPGCEIGPSMPECAGMR